MDIPIMDVDELQLWPQNFGFNSQQVPPRSAESMLCVTDTHPVALEEAYCGYFKECPESTVEGYQLSTFRDPAASSQTHAHMPQARMLPAWVSSSQLNVAVTPDCSGSKIGP